ncbi:MAG: tRNA guanosine(34) transglycosylase Tgt [Oscillospiraceae bacterium]|jgi:queuine tRNA-ribosyltransferase|nr:tRNA guanosine(34) transglycosylase Tgt [Oscillospiraceae bacterium]
MFRLLNSQGRARRGSVDTAHGVIETPVFMNVGTQAAVKGGLSCDDLAAIGCQVELSNTYHLHLRPGEDVVRNMGGLHNFMRWDRPVLTDSGGFQVFSLAKLRKITEQGVSFASHIDGRAVFMGPEESMRIQSALGADIAMAFDECVENPAPYDYVQASARRTVRWLTRCAEEHRRLSSDAPVNPGQQLWGINQGGVFEDIRVANMETIAEMNLAGYAIGGLAVGEETAVMYNILDILEPVMPNDKPRYLMGVGTPGNILHAVWRGVDFFDCVMPARNARHGHLFTWRGCRNIKNEKYKNDPLPIDEECGCPVCARYSRAYLRHLYKSGEILALRLGVMHNLYFYNDLMARIRMAIEEGRFETMKNDYADLLDTRI